jgi:hypothetical protein
LLISADIYRGGSLPAVKLRNNGIVDMPSGWQRNSNHAALGFVDEKTCPVFQFIRTMPFRAVLNGSFTDRDGKPIFANEKGVRFGGKLAECELKPVFKYPAWKYLGQYADAP